MDLSLQVGKDEYRVRRTDILYESHNHMTEAYAILPLYLSAVILRNVSFAVQSSTTIFDTVKVYCGIL